MALPVSSTTIYYEDNTVGTSSQSRRLDYSRPLLSISPGATPTDRSVTYYPHSEASDIAGYKKLLPVSADTGEANVGQSCGAADVPYFALFDKWVTEPGEPGIYMKYPGPLNLNLNPSLFYVMCKLNINGSPTYSQSIIIRLYKRNSAGVETLLASVSVSPTTTKGMRSVGWASPTGQLDQNDRLVLKYWYSVILSDPSI